MSAHLEPERTQIRQLLEVLPPLGVMVALSDESGPGYFRQERVLWLDARATLEAFYHQLNLQHLRGEETFSPRLLRPGHPPPPELMWLPVQWVPENPGQCLAFGPRAAHVSVYKSQPLTSRRLYANLSQGVCTGLLLSAQQPDIAQMRAALNMQEDGRPNLRELTQLALPAAAQLVADEWGVTIPLHQGLEFSRLALDTLHRDCGAVPASMLTPWNTPSTWIGTEHLWNLPPGMASALVSEARIRLTMQGRHFRRGLSQDWTHKDAWHLMECLREGRPSATTAHRNPLMKSLMDNFTALGGVILPHDACVYEAIERQINTHSTNCGTMPEFFQLSQSLKAAQARHTQVDAIVRVARRLETFQ